MEYINIPTYKFDTAVELGEYKDDDQPYANDAGINVYDVVPEDINPDLNSEHVYSDLIKPEADYENFGRIRTDPADRTASGTNRNEDDSSFNSRQKSQDTQRQDVRSDIDTEYSTLELRERASVYSNLQYTRKRRFTRLRRHWKKLVLLLVLIIVLLVTGVVTAVVLVTSTEEPVENSYTVEQDTSGTTEGSRSTEGSGYGPTEGSGSTTEGPGSGYTDNSIGSTDVSDTRTPAYAAKASLQPMENQTPYML